MADDMRQVIDNLNQWSVKMILDVDLSQRFMQWAMKFDGYFTVVNQMLIFLQCNNASIVKTEEEWNREHIRVKRDAKPIKTIFMADNRYIIRQFYDISQVDISPQIRFSGNYDIQDKVDAIMAGTPVKHQKKINIGDSRTHFMYVAEAGLIYYKPGVDSLEQIFIELAREYSHFSIKRLLETKGRLVQLGIRSVKTDNMQYSRGVFKHIADNVGFLVSDMYKVTDF